MPRPVRNYAVWLHQRRVGTLYTHDNHTRFVLDTEYTHDPNRAVLGLRFEQDLHAQHRSNVRLPPWFSNLLPEGHLRQWIAQDSNASETHEVKLLARLGLDLPGAVWVTEDQEDSTPPTAALREIVAGEPETRPFKDFWRFSLAGVALKFSMLQKGERFTAPGVGEGGDWIIKLPDPIYPQVPLNEFAMMGLARLAGLEVPETRLVHRDLLDSLPPNFWPQSEDQAYAIKRFDRSADSKRIHMEDLAQVRGVYPEDKYAGTFETIGALIFRQHDTASLVEFAKRLAFNILIGNGDAHLKNWSLLYVNPRIPKLSPAYDLVTTAVYRPSSEPEDLGLKFGGSRRFETISLSTFERLQKKLNAQGVSLSDEVNGFVGRVLAGWEQIAELLKAHPFLLDQIGNDLETRARTLLRP